MNINIKKILPGGKRGFTLIELMVSIAIFIVVMVVSLGALLSISAAARKAETLKSVMNNLSFALEGMSRTIRTGVSYHCSTSGTLNPLDAQDCPDPTNGSNYIALQANDGMYVAYCSLNNIIWRLRTPDAATLSGTSCGTGGFLPLTATEVSISNLKFYVTGAPQGDSIQPRINITLTGAVSAGTNVPSTFNIQTSVTQRIYDQ